MTVQYLRNKSNDMTYKAVNNCLLLVWLPSIKKWRRCCTQYSDLFNGDYMDNFIFLDKVDF